MRTRSFRLLLAKVFRAFRDIKAVFQARFGAHGAGPIPRRIKGLRIFARSTRAHPRVRARDHLKPAVANQTPDDRTVFLFDPGRVVLVVGTGPRHLKSLRPAPIDNRIVHEGSVVVAELKPARRRARPEQRAAPRYGSSPDSPLERRGFEPPVSFADRVAFFRRKKRSRRSIGIIPKRPIAFRDRWFESGSLQQRVGCEIDHAAQLRAILHASTLRQRVFGFAPDLCVS